MKIISSVSEITHDDLVNLFSTALSGCEVFTVDWPHDEPSLFKEKDCIEDKLARCLLAGKCITIGDLYSERGDKGYGNLVHAWNKDEGYMEYAVTLDAIERGLTRALNMGGWYAKYVRDLVDEECDFDYLEALALLQIILFGKEVYG